MNIYESLQNIPESAKNAVVAIGNFDGVHRGHQALLATAKTIAAEKKRPLAVLTFEPHPRRLFRPDDPPNRITPLSVKHWRLETFGVDTLFSLPFDWDFASQSASDFIANVLKDGINAAHVVVGADFCFGQLRKGAPEDIEKSGIPTTAIEKIAAADAQALSSSNIRQALRAGNLDAANEMLGWEWEMRGEVVKGDQRGRELGYPTANVKLGETVHPAYGVYAALVQIEGETQWRPAATNIGIRPMFEVPVAQVESFIFDFDEEIYGKILRTRPVKRLRGEAKFNSLDELIAQIAKDCTRAREILGA
ncbi:MAG: bifunctional riboflavin kinase/FAD synthetase [Alphaproteobacteria bacterium]